MISLFCILGSIQAVKKWGSWNRSQKTKNCYLGSDPRDIFLTLLDLSHENGVLKSFDILIYRSWCGQLSMFVRLSYGKCLVNLSTLELGIPSPIKDLNEGCMQEFLYCICIEIFAYNLWSIVTSFSNLLCDFVIYSINGSRNTPIAFPLNIYFQINFISLF